MNDRPILFSGPMVRAILDGRKTQTRRVVATRHPIEFLGGLGQESDLSAWGWFFDGPQRHGYMVLARGMDEPHDHGCSSIPCPYGEPGDRLWVRETWRTSRSLDALSPQRIEEQARKAGATHGPFAPALYVADGNSLTADLPEGGWGKTRVSIHMPRWASRLTLEVTDVRVQRLQEISEEDAAAEGVQSVVYESWTAYDPETEGYPSFGAEPDAEMIARRRLENVRHHGPRIISTAKEQFRLLWASINGERQGCAWESNPWVWAITFKRLP